MAMLIFLIEKFPLYQLIHIEIPILLYLILSRPGKNHSSVKNQKLTAEEITEIRELIDKAGE